MVWSLSQRSFTNVSFNSLTHILISYRIFLIVDLFIFTSTPQTLLFLIFYHEYKSEGNESQKDKSAVRRQGTAVLAVHVGTHCSTCDCTRYSSRSYHNLIFKNNLLVLRKLAYFSIRNVPSKSSYFLQQLHWVASQRSAMININHILRIGQIILWLTHINNLLRYDK